MIINLRKTKQYIVDWIGSYAKQAGLKTLVVGLSGGVDSALVALLCKETKTKYDLNTLCISMPCNSSDKSYTQALNFAKEFNLNFIKIILNDVFISIYDQVSIIKSVANNINLSIDDNIIKGGLRSCLRTPVLSFCAAASKGLIVGTGNRSEDNLIRYFQKFGDGSVDICPISDLFKREVYELFSHMAGTKIKEDNLVKIVLPPAALAIFEAAPTADLWGKDNTQTDEEELGITYDEIEWADRQNMYTNIVSDDTDPIKNQAWKAYSARQREVIAKMHALEKISRHKYNPNLPVCKIRNIGLVK